MRDNGLQLVDLQSGAELEIKRITRMNERMSHYQTELQELLSRTASQVEDRFKTLALIPTVKLAEINKKIKEIKRSMVSMPHRRSERPHGHNVHEQ